MYDVDNIDAPEEELHLDDATLSELEDELAYLTREQDELLSIGETRKAEALEGRIALLEEMIDEHGNPGGRAITVPTAFISEEEIEEMPVEKLGTIYSTAFKEFGAAKNDLPASRVKEFEDYLSLLRNTLNAKETDPDIEWVHGERFIAVRPEPKRRKNSKN